MVLYFGSSFTAYAAASDEFGFVTINVGRFLLASALLLVISRGRLGSMRQYRGRLLLAGAYGVGLMAILMAFGVDRASPTLASLVMALESPGIAVAAAFVARDRPTRAAIAQPRDRLQRARRSPRARSRSRPARCRTSRSSRSCSAPSSRSRSTPPPSAARRRPPTRWRWRPWCRSARSCSPIPMLVIDVLGPGHRSATRPTRRAIISVDHHRRRLGARLLADVERAREALRRAGSPSRCTCCRSSA